MKKLHILYILMALLSGLPCMGQNLHQTLLSTDEVRGLCFDSNGLMWICTDVGLKWYDGYRLHDFQNDGHNADVLRMTDDRLGNLWVGTNDGLLCVEQRTGRTSHYRLPRASQRIIYALFASSDGTLYVGTDDGFSIYNSVDDAFTHFNCDNTIVTRPDGTKDHFWGYSVKDFLELDDGSVLMGTWSNGLLRYFPARKTFKAYGQLNAGNSAYALCTDAKGRLWIGTQGNGVYRLESPDDYRLQTLTAIGHAGVVDDIAVHEASGRVCICSDGKVLLWDESADSGQWKRITDMTIGTARHFTVQADGTLWVQTLSDGIYRLYMGDAGLFNCYQPGVKVRSIYTDDDEHFYTGQGLPSWALAKCTVRRWNGELWTAAYIGGISVRCVDDSTTVIGTGTTPWLKDAAEWLYESPRDSSLWVGQRMGLSVIRKDGTGKHINLKNDSLDMTGYFMVRHITEDKKGNVWVSSSNDGIVKIGKDARFTETGRIEGTTHYCTRFGTLPTDNITACHADSRGHLWAATGSHGLLLFDEGKGCFERTAIPLLSKKVLAVNEDDNGNLWIATDKALVRLSWKDGAPVTAAFTTEDGLPATQFYPNATYHHGNRLYFGTTNGFFGFTPDLLYQSLLHNSTPYKLIITDLLIDGVSYTELDSLTAANISGVLPTYAEQIVIPAAVQTFCLQFSLLSYTNQEQVSYEYRLEGLGSDWQPLESGLHQVTFDRLPSGTYRLHLRATDCHGQAFSFAKPVVIRVLPPWYRTWWAYTLYVCLLAAAIWFLHRYLQMRREWKASRRFSTILQSAQMTVDTPFQKEEPSLHPSIEGQRNATFVAHATQLVHDHLDDSDYNRDRLAADLGMSVSSLYARLRENTDLSIQTFIQTIRLNAACDILRQETDIRISELAYRVGFNTPKYFSQCFKKEFGMLPGEYVKKKQE